MLDFLRYFVSSSRVRWADPHGAGPVGYVLAALCAALASLAIAGWLLRRRSGRLRATVATAGLLTSAVLATSGCVRLWFDLATAIPGIARFALESGGELLALGSGVPVGLPDGPVALVRRDTMDRKDLMTWLAEGDRLVVARASTLDRLSLLNRLGIVWEGAGLVVASRETPWYWRRPMVTWVGPEDAELVWETPDAEVGKVLVRGPARRRWLIEEAAPRKVHHARVEGLDPATVYLYRLVSSAVPTESEGAFRTLPAPGSPEPLRFAVIGDSGGGHSVTRKLVRRIDEFEPDFVLHVGDLAYDRSSQASLYDQFYGPFEELTARIPVWFVPGNHDVLDGGRDLASFVALEPESDMAVHYQRLLRTAGVMVASVNSNAPPLPFGATRRAFLAAMRDERNPPWWRIAFFHHPPFAGEGRGRNQVVYAVLHPLLVRSHVDVAFAGHSHNYQRSRPIGLFRPDPGGVRYVVSGGGGGELREPTADPEIEVADEVHHLLRVVTQEGRLWLEAIDETGAVLDHVVLARDAPHATVREEPWSEPPADQRPKLPALDTGAGAE